MRLLLILPVLAAPALAQEQPPDTPGPERRAFQPPPGCTPYVTIQMADCTVSHHFRCEGDPEGYQRRVSMDEGGIAYAGVIDAETQWIESDHFLSGHRETLGATPDPASLSTLIATGLDSWDFTTESPQIGPTRYVGQDRLTGETVTIDGVQLDRTEYQITAYDGAGTEVWRGAGNEFISRDWRMFVSGTSSTVVGEEVTDEDATPVEFVFPGEPGFLSVSPKHGCGLMTSSWMAP